MWLKLLVLIVGAATVIAVDDLRDLYMKIDAGEEIEISPLVDPYDGISYRLPNDTSPLTYDVWLSTDIHRGEFAFDGRVMIRFEVLETTNEVIIQYRLMTIQSINLFNADGVMIEENVDYFQNDTVEFLHIRPTQQLLEGQQFSVQVFYNGSIRDNGLGIYSASYINPSGNRTWLATTQFQANEARHAFPCYDEPARRSLFTIAIRHDASYIALSNMPVASIVAEPGTNYVLTTFDQSLSMQTYLVAFTISDFAFVAEDSAVPPQRIYGKTHSIERGEGDFALEVSLDLMPVYEDYIGIPYSFPKMDQFACPDFAFGAMENWGLAVYREPNMLYDPEIDRTRDQENIVTIISHEFVHMWFGNLVSPEWWTFLWINEGFAAMYQYQLPHKTYPDDRYMDNFFISYQRVAMELDANPAIRAMSHYVENPDRIEDLFDFVSYHKAGSVLHMMQNALTPSTWVKGLNYFLNERAYNYYNAGHLYEGLQQSADEDFPDSAPNVAAIMNTWEMQAGVPVVSVSRNMDEINFYQERFFYGDDESDSIFAIPISYVVGSNPDFSSTSPDLWLDTRSSYIWSDSAPKPWTENDWMIVNIQQSGYYRVNYDSNLWVRIINQLNAPGDAFEQIHVLNRAQLIDDSFHLARAGKTYYDYVMGVMNYLEKETDHVPWAMANRAFTLLNRWLSGSPLYGQYQSWVRKNTRLLYDQLGVNVVENELRTNRYNRLIAVDLACQAGNDQCLTDANELLLSFIASGERVTPDLVQTLYCNGVRRADAGTVASVQSILLGETRQRERNFIISGLGCIENPQILYTHLFLAIHQFVPFSNAERSSILLSPLNHGERSLQVMIDFVRLNYGGVNLINPNQVTIMCSNIAQRVSSETMFTEFSALLSHLQVNGAITSQSANNFRVSARGILEWQEQHLYYFMRFFGRHPQEP